ncbi:MAG: methyltransferase domain-containing protein [Segetibacter sp.]
MISINRKMTAKMFDERHTKNKIIFNFNIERGETQKNVNEQILKHLSNKFSSDKSLKILDLPCGSSLFITYLTKLFPNAEIFGADIQKHSDGNSERYLQMDLSKDLLLKKEEKFDLITSISGVMMFSNTSNFISNCVNHLHKEGTFIVTNDNFRTIKDKLSLLFLGRDRLFKMIYEDSEEVTQQVPIQELCRLLRINVMTIAKIEYTSFYIKDLIYLPIAILIYPIQCAYIWRHKTNYHPV